MTWAARISDSMKKTTMIVQLIQVVPTLVGELVAEQFPIVKQELQEDDGRGQHHARPEPARR